MRCCSVNGCNRRSNTSSLQKDGVTFHLFPNDCIGRSKWAEACHRKENWAPARSSSICSRHFEKCSFIDMPNNRRILCDGACPTLHLLGSENDDSSMLNDNKEVPSISSEATETQELSDQYSTFTKIKEEDACNSCETTDVQTCTPNTELRTHTNIYERASSSELQANPQAKVFKLPEDLQHHLTNTTVTCSPKPNPQLKIPDEQQTNIPTIQIKLLLDHKEITLREQKLRSKLKLKNMHIKRLASKTRYLTDRVRSLRSTLKTLNDKLAKVLKKEKKMVPSNAKQLKSLQKSIAKEI